MFNFSLSSAFIKRRLNFAELNKFLKNVNGQSIIFKNRN